MKLTIILTWGILLIAPPLRAVQNVDRLCWEERMLAGRVAIGNARYADAEQIYAALVADLGKKGVAGERLGLSLGQLGAARLALGRHAEAANLLLRSIAILEAAPETHLENLATVLQGLGSSYYYQHQFARAERAYGKALDLRSRVPSTDRRVVADLLSNLGSVYQIEGRSAQARDVLERARELLDQIPESDPIFRAKLLNNIGTVARAEGRHDEAERTYRAAAEVLAGVWDADGVLTISLLNNLALECMRRNQYREAAGILSRAVDRMETGTALSRTDVTAVLRHYRRCLQETGDRREISRLDARAKLILSLKARQPSEGLTVDVSQLGRTR